MIYESQYWKEDLHRNARWLVEALSKKRWTSRSLSKLEKSIMISAYAIRKLNESSRILDSLLKQEIKIGIYEKKQFRINKFNYYNIEKHYDLENMKIGRMNIGKLLNQIIHSYIFIPAFDEKGMISKILINSDYTKEKSLYSVEYRSLIDIIMNNSTGSLLVYRCDIRNGNFTLIDTIYESNKTIQ